MMTWPGTFVSTTLHDLSALQSASALSKPGAWYLVARMYVFFATFSRAPESLIGSTKVLVGCGVARESPQSHADSLFEKYFANADGGTPCYTRVYDAQHLRRNPHQKVRQITLAFDHAKVPWCQHLHRPKVDICGSVHQ